MAAASTWLGLAAGTRPVLAAERPASIRAAAAAEIAWMGGRYAAAAEHSIAAYRLDPRHSVHLYNAARAWHRAQRCEEALRWYRNYLDLAGPNAPRRELALRLADAIAAGTDVDCPTAPATTQAIVESPWPPEPAEDVTAVVAAAEQARRANDTSPARVHALGPGPASPGAGRVLGWTLVGSGGVALVTGTWLFADALPDLDAPERTLRDAAQRKRDLGLVGTGVGAVAGGFGLWLLLRDDPARPAPRLGEALTARELLLRGVALRPLGRSGALVRVRVGW